jgi:hypothetical protein
MKKLIILGLLIFSSFIQTGYCIERDSKHFILFFEAQDTIVIDTIIKTLEYGYTKVTADLQMQLYSKTKVHIYPDIYQLHQAINWPDAPDWLVGVGTTEIFVVSPLNPGPAHTYKEILNNVFIHEFTHICTNQICNYLPIWLSEGFSCYEGGPYYKKSSIVAAYKRLGKIPSLDELNSSYDNFVSLDGYGFGLTIAKFMVETFGMDATREFIYEPNDFSVFSGISKDEFENEWFEYVRSNYLDETDISITADTKNQLINIYPNPAVNTLNISLSGNKSIQGYTIICNSAGKILSRQSISKKQFSIDVSQLKPGLYFLNITFNSEHLQVKFLKQ